jgi:hypothetical protein
MKKKIFILFLTLAASMETMFASDAYVDGIYYNLDANSLTASVTYQGASSSSFDEYTGAIVIPSSITYKNKTYTVTSIGNYTFSGCTSLRSVTISNGLTSIGQEAFKGCTWLTSVAIPSSITSIGHDAFNGCGHLTSITIPNGITSIATNTFYGCERLNSINIPNSVTSIGKSAFYACDSLKSITIPNSVTSIGDHAFFGCGLTSVTIPNSITSIEDATFMSTSLTSVTIPNSVTHIGDHAFDACTRLTSVTIPSRVGYVGNNAFDCCVALTSVICKAVEPPTCGGYAFRDVVGPDGYGSVPLYVPAGSEQSYQSATWWQHFSPIVPIQIGNKYTITFVDYDGTELQVLTNVEAGSIPSYTGATPTRPSDNRYTYTFSGWSPSVAPATANVTYTAKFRPTEIQILGQDINSTWLQTGGTDLGEMTTSNPKVWKYNSYYGAVAQTGNGKAGWLLTPVKNLNGMQSVTLSFSHVHKNAGTFNRDMTLWVCADYKGSVGTSTWKQLTISPYAANTNWTYVNVTIDVPLNMVGANTVFGFKYSSSDVDAKWEIKNVHLQAVYNNVAPETYTIRFLNYDGTELQVLTDVAEGTMPVYTGATPTRPDDNQYTYTFSGWSPTIVAATANATYTAQFTATEKQPITICEDATWLQTGGSDLGEMSTNNTEVWMYNPQYGAVGKKQGGGTGWLLTPSKNLLGMQSITLSFSHTHKFATVLDDELTLWVCADYQGSVEASSWQQLTISPYAANTNWTFVDVSIDVPLNMVGANTVFGFKYVSTSSGYATWEIKDLHLEAECKYVAPETYTITFLNYDGTELQVLTDVEEGTMPVYTGVTPTKPSNEQYTYTFNGWSPEIVEATEDATYTATFSNVLNTYTISANAVNGRVEGTGEYAYGTIVSLTAIPDNGYVFNRWLDGVKDNPRTITVTGDAAYNALFVPAEGVDNISAPENIRKVLVDGQIYILRGDKTYTTDGRLIR